MNLEPMVAAALGRGVGQLRAVHGGDLNDAYRIEFEDGGVAFAKTRAGAPAEEYATEAAGLRWLAEPGALAVPEVLAVLDEPAALVLEWIEEGRLGASAEEELGRGLAAVHGAGAPAFGAGSPLRLGPLTIPNDPAPTWAEFYAQSRLRPLAREAHGALPEGTGELIERVCERLPELAGPEEPPARLHGDLWSGNVLAGADGRPYLIDPAAYGGHREVDLAMLRLFGGPSERCFAAYNEAAPLAEGHGERVALWQLFPLLVHAALFGGGYGGSVARIAARYA